MQTKINIYTSCPSKAKAGKTGIVIEPGLTPLRHFQFVTLEEVREWEDMIEVQVYDPTKHNLVKVEGNWCYARTEKYPGLVGHLQKNPGHVAPFMTNTIR